jgi:hypothetical protein
VNGPWNQLNLLLQAFNKTNYPALWEPMLQLSVAVLVVMVFYYNFQSRRLRAYTVFLDLNEWLMWTTLSIFSLMLMFSIFSFDFIFVLPTMVLGGLGVLWIRFIHFPPLIRAYEERLARQRYFQRTRVSHPSETIRAKTAPKGKRRRGR